MTQSWQDQVAIRDLLSRYTINGDRGRTDALVATFAEGGTLRFGAIESTGRAAILARLSDRSAGNPALTLTRHHLSSSMIEVTGTTATGRSYFQVLSDIGLDHHGVYMDRMTRVDGMWLFSYRDVRIDWQSPHSLYPKLHVRGVAPG